MKHRKTYMVIYSPCGMAWAFDRNYHFLGTESEWWAPIELKDIAQMEPGACCTSRLPVEEEDALECLKAEGFKVMTIWTNYYK